MHSEYQQVSASADYMDNSLNHFIGGEQSVLREYQLNQSYHSKPVSLMQQNFISYLLYIVSLNGFSSVKGFASEDKEEKIRKILQGIETRSMLHGTTLTEE